MPLRNLHGATLCHFKKGERLILQDETIAFLYYLVDGVVHRELLATDGDELDLNIILPTDGNNYIRSLIGVFSLYNKHEHYIISNSAFVAHTDCTCYRIPVPSYFVFEKEHREEVFEQLFLYAIDSYQELFDLYYSKHHKNLSALLCSHILKHTVLQDNQWIYDQRVSQVELSKRLDIHPVNISQIMSTLTKEGALQKLSNRIYLVNDKEYIQAVASNELEVSYQYNEKHT